MSERLQPVLVLARRRNGERKPLVTAGNITFESTLGEGPPERPVSGPFPLKTNEHAVVMLGILIEVTVLDTVVDDLRIDLSASQI